MKKVLMICNTVYQIMIAVNLRITTYNEDEVDIIISDHISNGKRIYSNICNMKWLFDEIFYVQSYSYCIAQKGRLEKLKDGLNYKSNFKKMVDIKKNYDLLLGCNLDKFFNLTYTYIKTILNKNLKVFLFEDGYSTYVLMDKFYYNDKKLASCKFQNIIMNRKYAVDSLKGLYVTNKSNIIWKSDFPIIQMQQIKGNSKLIEILDEIFGYKNMKDIYDKKIIFFEESYYKDKFKVDDIGIVNEISNIVGKENIMVKIHPRNDKNRFKELGYKTNIDTFIPWELIALHNNLNDKILITIASGSIATPYTIFGMITNSVSLLNLFDIKFNELQKQYNEFLIEKIYKPNKDIFFLPNNLLELDSYIKNKFYKGKD